MIRGAIVLVIPCPATTGSASGSTSSTRRTILPFICQSSTVAVPRLPLSWNFGPGA